MTLIDKIEKEIANFYFVHCKPKVRPQFKTAAEAEAWNKINSYSIESIVDKTTDRILNLLSHEKEKVE